MARPKVVKALPRGQRNHPQEAQVFSSNFPEQILNSEEKCFTTWSDYKKLEKKYLSLFKHYNKLRTEIRLLRPLRNDYLDLINKYHDKNEAYHQAKQALSEERKKD